MVLWSVRAEPAGKGPNLYDIRTDGSCLRCKGTWYADTLLAISGESGERMYGARIIVKIDPDIIFLWTMHF